MTRYVAFLRGVNVGGVNLKMAEVAAALTEAGFGQVRAVSEKYPFEREVDGHHSYVTFVTDPDVLDELAGLASPPCPTKESNAARASFTGR